MLTVSITQYKDHFQQNKSWVGMARELYKTKEMIRALEKEAAKLADDLKLFSDYKNAKGGGFIFTKNERKGSVQYKNIPELVGVTLDEYRGKSVEIWKLERK